MKHLSVILSLLLCVSAFATTPFRVAQLTDLHISRSNPKPLEDLHRSIDDINAQHAVEPIAFVLVCGDVTEAGDRQSMREVKAELDRLAMPYHITSGNHETTWSESGCTDFPLVFGSDRFSFVHDDICFLGFNSGPRLKMSDGHVVPQDLTWAKHILDSLPKNHKVIGVTHYPLQEGDVDNWYEVTDLFRQYNTQCFIGGHYHRNLLFNADGISDVLCRSNLRGKDDVNGYTIITFASNSITFAEKPVNDEADPWLTIPLQDYDYTQIDSLPRPSFEVNTDSAPHPTVVWRVQVGVGIYNSAACDDKNAYVADDEGNLRAYSLQDGHEVWRTTFEHMKARICGVPLVEDGCIVFANTAGMCMCMSTEGPSEENMRWMWVNSERLSPEKRPILGCPIMATVGKKKVVLLGGNGTFSATDFKTGNPLWTTSIEGYCVTRPCVYEDKVYFGTWGCHFYALNLKTGKIEWSWTNGSTNDKFSPASVWPVASNGKAFIVAPDRYMTCLNAKTGEVVWRTNKHMVRENIGISADGNTVYARCMQDSVVAIDATTDTLRTIWKESAEYGYDHNPSMMIEMGNQIVFGTKNGLMHGVDAATGKVLWRHKIGNCLVNTICPLSNTECLVTSSDGQLLLLRLPSLNP